MNQRATTLVLRIEQSGLSVKLTLAHVIGSFCCAKVRLTCAR